MSLLSPIFFFNFDFSDRYYTKCQGYIIAVYQIQAYDIKAKNLFPWNTMNEQEDLIRLMYFCV